MPNWKSVLIFGCVWVKHVHHALLQLMDKICIINDWSIHQGGGVLDSLSLKQWCVCIANLWLVLPTIFNIVWYCLHTILVSTSRSRVFVVVVVCCLRVHTYLFTYLLTCWSKKMKKIVWINSKSYYCASRESNSGPNDGNVGFYH